jgi:hypothetical protein
MPLEAVHFSGKIIIILNSYNFCEAASGVASLSLLSSQIYPTYFSIMQRWLLLLSIAHHTMHHQNHIHALYFHNDAFPEPLPLFIHASRWPSIAIASHFPTNCSSCWRTQPPSPPQYAVLFLPQLWHDTCPCLRYHFSSSVSSICRSPSPFLSCKFGFDSENLIWGSCWMSANAFIHQPIRHCSPPTFLDFALVFSKTLISSF